MSVSGTVDVIESALWQQGDIRDPLGIWGTRLALNGDGTGGSYQFNFQVPSAKRSAYVYTVYNVQVVQLAGPIKAKTAKLRILTGWPDIDPLAGIQGFSSYLQIATNGEAGFTAPIAGPEQFPLVQPLDRFLIIHNPQAGGDVNILELQLDDNKAGENYSAECYGYYWDRSVMNAPGGLRHPGSA